MKKLFTTSLVLMGPGIFFGFLVGLYPGKKTFDYMWKNPNFCLSCHVHDYVNVAFEHSVHGNQTTCHDCHHQSLKALIHEGWVTLTDPPRFPSDLDHIPDVPKKLCGSCHLSTFSPDSITGPLSGKDVSILPKVDKNYMHRVHLNEKTELKKYSEIHISEELRGFESIIPHSFEKGSAREITCSDCHATSANRAHQFSANDHACIRCHQAPHKGFVGKEFGCRSCHFPYFYAQDE